MAVKVLALRRADRCSVCSIDLDTGTRAQWDGAARLVTCLPCVELAATRPAEATMPVVLDPPPPLDVGTAGASADREHQRLHDKHERRIEEKWGTGRIGWVAKALSTEPQTTTAWAKGARGEERVAKILSDRLGDRAVLLHDRRVPGTRGNIDHLAIVPSGIWVVDAKAFAGKVERRDVDGWFRTDVLCTSVDGTAPPR